MWSCKSVSVVPNVIGALGHIITSIMAKFGQILWESFRNILKRSLKHHKNSEIACSPHNWLSFLTKWYALETRLHLIVIWFHWKPPTKRERNCSGRSRVRRILLTCIQLLLLQFLHVIWSTPTNLAFFKKPLDIFFFINLTTRDQSPINTPCKFQEHWKQRRLLNRASNITNFSTRFCVYKWASSL